ncbi:Uncharacterized protein YhaN [Marininema mesophilum]|uniref:Uncharacterized protein YhaN n=1 Tax=Marininema mesophilum TaxID=1048340 RepID=A0A1H2VG96_9BACL|nr:AAA family ATPase [Marininema mesophilum]SDW67377.1 Uncharacterized protein YhaN [Marininema mesophilum]
MKIDRLAFRGFGRWVDRSFEFSEGLNLLEAPNEAGKSTLIQGLDALLYGGKKEGVSRRQKADWYDIYLPWNSDRYGGEVDFTLEGQEYRIIRSLRWDEDREQLVLRSTGRELTGEFEMDRRKDRRFIEGLTGLSVDLFTRVAHIGPQTSGDDRHVVERIRQIITQGEETDLKPALERLERDIQQIGKTDQARSKPYGASVAKVAEQAEEVKELRRLYEDLRGDQARLATLKNELMTLAEEQHRSQEEVGQIKRRVQRSERLHHLRDQEENLRYRLSRWEAVASKFRQLEAKRHQVMPEHLLSAEETNELRQLMEERNTPIVRLEVIKKRLIDLEEEGKRVAAENSHLLNLDESLLQRHIHRLDEASRLEEKLKAPDAKGTVDDRVKGMQLEKDTSRLMELQEREESYRRNRRELEDTSATLSRRLDLFEREQFISQVVDSQIPPGKTSSKWLFMGGGGLVIGVLLMQQSVFFGCLTLFGGGVALYRYYRLWGVDRQIHQDWLAQRSSMQGDQERLRREREVAEAEGESLNQEMLRTRLAEKRKLLQTAYDELAIVIKEQESIFSRWNVASLVELHKKADEQRKRIQDRETASQLDQQYRERLKEIYQEAVPWGEENQLTNRLGPYQVKNWLEELTKVADEARIARETGQRIKLETTTLTQEQKSLEATLERTEQEVARWTERLGTGDFSLWKSWLEAGDHVRQLDEQIREALREKEELTQAMEEEEWEKRLMEIEEELASLDTGEEEVPLPELKASFTEAEGVLDRVSHFHRQKEVEVLKLDERLQVRADGLPSLADRETQLDEMRERLKVLTEQRTALETARDVLLEAAQEVQEDIAPRLRPYASQWLQKITGRYEDLLIDPAKGLELSVFVPETGERQPIEHLSRGTVDQMYFALRLSLIRFFSENTAPLPIILDDSLVHFDDERLKEALQILGELSETHQVILCTCQKREGLLLEELGISLNRQAI